MRNMKNTLKVIVLSSLSLTFINCSSGSPGESQGEISLKNDESEQRVVSFIENELPVDFPVGSNFVRWDEQRTAFVVSNNKSGCSILAKEVNETVKIHSEVDCSY